jgi:hypothetical protein
MKVFNYVFGFVFIVFALLQINDPDPYLWIPIYGYASLLSFLNAKNKYDGFANYALIIFCVLYGAKLLLVSDGVVSWYNQHEGHQTLDRKYKRVRRAADHSDISHPQHHIPTKKPEQITPAFLPVSLHYCDANNLILVTAIIFDSALSNLSIFITRLNG